MKVFFAALLALGLVAAACGSDNGDSNTEPTATTERRCAPASETPPAVDGQTYTTEGGVQVTIVQPPETEDPISSGDAAAVQYAGWLEDGTLFDTSLDTCDPFFFQLDAGEVIQGWDEGLDGMSPGEVRRLVIPPELAYGDDGFRDLIPPGATLTFDVELVAFGRPNATEEIGEPPRQPGSSHGRPFG